MNYYLSEMPTPLKQKKIMPCNLTQHYYLHDTPALKQLCQHLVSGQDYLFPRPNTGQNSMRFLVNKSFVLYSAPFNQRHSFLYSHDSTIVVVILFTMIILLGNFIIAQILYYVIKQFFIVVSLEIAPEWYFFAGRHSKTQPIYACVTGFRCIRVGPKIYASVFI